MSSISDELPDTAVETESEIFQTVPSLLTDTSPNNETEPSLAAKQPANKRGHPHGKHPAQAKGEYMHLHQ